MVHNLHPVRLVPMLCYKNVTQSIFHFQFYNLCALSLLGDMLIIHSYDYFDLEEFLLTIYASSPTVKAWVLTEIPLLPINTN